MRGLNRETALRLVGALMLRLYCTGQTVQVTTRVVDGVARIVDAWAKTKRG